MRVKDSSVECKFHPMLTDFLFDADEIYREWGSEVTLTSGSESGTRHGFTSLHYATPGQAADIRSWAISLADGGKVIAEMQAEALEELAQEFCDRNEIPDDWLEVILESNHIHFEYQPKRLEGV